MKYPNVINFISRMNIGYQIYANAAENLTWGKKYYSYNNKENEIIFYFPNSPLKIHQVLIMPSDDVFPVNWTQFF